MADAVVSGFYVESLTEARDARDRRESRDEMLEVLSSDPELLYVHPSRFSRQSRPSRLSAVYAS